MNFEIEQRDEQRSVLISQHHPFASHFINDVQSVTPLPGCSDLSNKAKRTSSIPHRFRCAQKSQFNIFRILEGCSHTETFPIYFLTEHVQVRRNAFLARLVKRSSLAWKWTPSARRKWLSMKVTLGKFPGALVIRWMLTFPKSSTKTILFTFRKDSNLSAKALPYAKYVLAKNIYHRWVAQRKYLELRNFYKPNYDMGNGGRRRAFELYLIIQSDLICGHIQVHLNRRTALDAYAMNENVDVTRF